VALQRPVLLDDPELAPLAYSRQWGEVDTVRSESILARGASTAVRDALLAQGISTAVDYVRVEADPALAMAARVCLPVRADGALLGYIWLLDAGAELTEAELDLARDVAESIGRALRPPARRTIREEGVLVRALCSRDPRERQHAVAEARARRLLPDGPVVLCLLSSQAEALDAAAAAARRLSIGHAIIGGTEDRAALVAALADPVLRTLPVAGVAAWVQTATRARVAVGQSAGVPLDALHEAERQSAIALHIARSRSAGTAAIAWPALGADRLVAQLPPRIGADVPQGMARLLRDEPTLVATLSAFLECAGDVKSTAAQLNLHRSGVYYRLRRIEEITGLELHSGDDRLLAHLAIRAAQLF
jgi:hypothetical protein